MRRETRRLKDEGREMRNETRRLKDEERTDRDTAIRRIDQNARRDEKQEEKNYCRNIMIITIITIIINLLIENLLYMSMSVAKAWSCLRHPSIITSKHYRSINHSYSLWSLRLSFTTREPKLKPSLASFGTKALPARVKKKKFLKYLKFK